MLLLWRVQFGEVVCHETLLSVAVHILEHPAPVDRTTNSGFCHRNLLIEAPTPGIRSLCVNFRLGPSQEASELLHTATNRTHTIEALQDFIRDLPF